MKIIKSSFLYVYLVLISVLFLSVPACFSQQSQDSLIYYDRLVSHPHDVDDLVKSHDFFSIAKADALKAKDSVKIIYHIFQLARIEHKGGFYSKSEASSVQALQILDKLKDTPYNIHLRTSIYTHLGILYREQKNKPKALELYEKALEIAKSPEDSVKLYNNKSNIYKDVNDYPSAKTELLLAHQLIPRIKDTLTTALVLDNLGYVNYKLKAPDALPLMLQALDLRVNSKNDTKAYPSYKNLAHYYYDTEPIKAKAYALKAYEIATRLNSASYKMDALSLLMEFSTDDYAKAYKHISDSVTTTRQLQENKFALMKYDLSEKVREAQESELISQRAKIVKQRYQFMALSLILISIGLYWVLKSKHKKDSLQKVYETESSISKKIHDDVANNVFQVMTKLQHQNTNEDILDALELIYAKTRDISKEHSVLDLDDSFDAILSDLIISYKSKFINIIVKDISKIKWDAMSTIKKETIYKVLQELLINMTKHSQASLAVISFQDTPHQTVITYTDNGVGCTLITNTGLQNVENRIKAIDGTVIFEPVINKGFKATLNV
ncbi:tetratricopeptide repeat protein [Gelidibacter salicanalis]|uniref:Tetratricopeptide repeat protein n=1 Tax=Gelidibacter salicanalis TaxID=291193 RepID=A0A5C7AT37_9FLAO|nr:tetratricopeptide repeat-containing sensor histidine kinase [Gelidibacter salicanalis]TXE10763.1 tetratricopeptide repeat protein [Gelidibacter salicanalis]